MVDVTWPTTAGDGSLLLCYPAGRRGYFKRVSRTGAIAGGFGPPGVGCPFVVGYRSGFIGTSDRYLPFKRALDLSNPHHIRWITSEEPGRKPRAGDAYLGTCTDSLSDDDPRYVQYEEVGCAYSPQARALYRMSPVLAIDAQGRTWSVSGHTLVVSGGHRRWQSQPLPGRPVTLLTSDGDSAAVFLSDEASSIFVTNDAGRSWHRVNGVPAVGGEGIDQNILPGGRLLLGPSNGQIWRGTDATNRDFDVLDAGPMTTLLAGGNRIFGLADGDERRVVRGMAWMSEDAGSTWRQVLDARRATVPRSRPVPADQLRPVKIPPVELLTKQLPPRDVAVSGNGSVLIIYSRHLFGHTTAWRLFNRRGQVVAEQAGGAFGVEPAGRGFLLQTTSGVRFVDASGTSRAVDWKENLNQQTRPSDVFVHGYGVYRPSTAQLFNGLAKPNGTVSAEDDTGRMWALGKHTPGQTVLRSAHAGGSWNSRVLGPSIGAIDVQGKGRTLMVVGKHRMYISSDAGHTWTLVRHDAAEYSSDVDPGGPQFTIWPDGTIYAGDFRAGWKISYDRRTFHDASENEVSTPMIGDLFSRTLHKRTDVSIDRQHWFRFTPSTARTLLAASPVG